MSQDRPTAAELTHRLIAREHAPADDVSAATAASYACECVSAEFSRWVGARGYEALTSRALVETRVQHPALENMRYILHSDPALTGVPESVERFGAKATAAGLSALLEMILALLSRLIGDDIVVTLVERSMENWERDAQRRARTSTNGVLARDKG